MKIAFLGSNEEEVQALNMYFLKNFAPKEGLEMRYFSNSKLEYYDKNTKDLYVIRIAQENIKACRFDRIHYIDTIREELICHIIYPMCLGREKPIKLSSDLMIDYENRNQRGLRSKIAFVEVIDSEVIFNIFCPKCGKRTKVISFSDSYGGGGVNIITNCDSCNIYINYEKGIDVDKIVMRDL